MKILEITRIEPIRQTTKSPPRPTNAWRLRLDFRVTGSNIVKKYFCFYNTVFPWLPGNLTLAGQTNQAICWAQAYTEFILIPLASIGILNSDRMLGCKWTVTVKEPLSLLLTYLVGFFAFVCVWILFVCLFLYFLFVYFVAVAALLLKMQKKSLKCVSQQFYCSYVDK